MYEARARDLVSLVARFIYHVYRERIERDRFVVKR